jgi:hypothetical protein
VDVVNEAFVLFAGFLEIDMALFYGIFVIYCAGVGKCGELGVLFENL